MNTDVARAGLVKEQARLEGLLLAATRLHDGAQEAQERELSSADQHPAELATETIERELDQSVVLHVQAELVEMQNAVEKLNNGAYGLCEACKQPISEARLEAMPAARYCIEDQAKLSRNGRRNGSR
ncbi:MAG: TraR/DksA C4-type zinc finger protein [Candidatus Dormibacteria bacterium]